MLVSHRRIKLVSELQTTFTPNVTDSFRIRITASNGHLMPDKIFAWRLIPRQPGQSTLVAIFDHVCSSADLHEYPEDAPRINDAVPWFRLNYIDIEDTSKDRALATQAAVYADVAMTIASMNACDVLAAEPPVWFGYGPAQEALDGSSISDYAGSLN